MRLREEKIDRLAHQIVDMMKKNLDIRLHVDEHTLAGEIRKIITHDLRREDEVEEEVRIILEKELKNSGMINYDYNQLFKMSKKHLAKERGLVF